MTDVSEKKKKKAITANPTKYPKKKETTTWKEDILPSETWYPEM